MTLVLSLELIKTYRVLFPLVDAFRSFRVSRGAHMCPPPPGHAKVAQTPGRARVNIEEAIQLLFDAAIQGNVKVKEPPA